MGFEIGEYKPPEVQKCMASAGVVSTLKDLNTDVVAQESALIVQLRTNAMDARKQEIVNHNAHQFELDNELLLQKALDFEQQADARQNKLEELAAKKLSLVAAFSHACAGTN